ncbi:MAG: hypothetical protein PUG33_07100 [Mollicutes bacterium]|nr:hypothetical protein [Mollicutes bacterium]
MKKNFLILLLLFILLLIFNLFLYPITLDEIWNYGFSYNILNGKIPYLDFNIVLTPLFSFIMTLPLMIFGNNILVFNIFNIFIILGCFLLLHSLIDDNMWLCALIFFIPFPILYPSYNLFLLLLFLYLIYLEKNEKSDYLIGFIVGCLILTKQSVGVFLLLPCLLYYLKNKKKFISRLIGCIIPCSIFLIYLLITKSFMSFLDLCLFGLFDFAGNNSVTSKFYLFVFILICLVTIIFIVKEPKNIYNYYALMFYSISMPLFDAYHVGFQILVFVLLCFINFNFLKRLPIYSFAIFLVVYACLFVSYSYGNISSFKKMYPNNINHFEYRYLGSKQVDFTNEVSNYIKKNKDYKYMFLDSNGYYFRIINDESASYLDLINMGNWGYNGSDKLINSIKKLPKNTRFFIDGVELVGQRQIDRRAIKYVIKHGKKVDKVGLYDIYILEN